MPQPSRPAAPLEATWSATIYVLGLIASAMAVAAMIERGFGLDLFAATVSFFTWNGLLRPVRAGWWPP